jgi:hypothetical protein
MREILTDAKQRDHAPRHRQGAEGYHGFKVAQVPPRWAVIAEAAMCNMGNMWMQAMYANMLCFAVSESTRERDATIQLAASGVMVVEVGDKLVLHGLEAMTAKRMPKYIAQSLAWDGVQAILSTTPFPSFTAVSPPLPP